MAPAEESSYFPSLDRCLDGEVKLLSWRSIYTALSDEDSNLGHQAIESHFANQRAIIIITRSPESFSAPTNQSKASFDTITSSINVTAAANGKYDANTLKEDSLWLSKKVNIDEVSALRFVVLEYQSRPATRLLQGQPGDDSAGGQSGAGSGLKSSLLLSRSSALKAPEANEGESFDSTKSRRLRVLETYLSERQYICKIKDLIIGYLCELHGPRPDTRDGSGDNSLDGSSASRHHKVLSRAFPDLAGLQTKTSDRWIGQEVQSLEIKFQQLLQGSGWPEDDSSPHLERSWYRTQLVELVHTMQSVLSVAETHPKLMTSHAMASWFNLMGQVKFLSRLDMPFPDLVERYSYSLRSLVALISLAMIKISPALVTIQELESTAQATTDPPESRSWLQDADCVEHITAVLYDACINNAGAAGVASFAWAIASAAIKEHAGRSQETRENRQSQRAIDSLNSPLFSDTEGGESSHARRRTSPQRRSSFGSDSSQQTTYLEEVYNKIQNVAPNDDVISALAKISVDEMGVFLIVSDLSVNFCASSGFQTNPIRGCSTRLQLLDLVRSSLPIIDYRPEIVETVLAILLGGDDYWESLHRSVQYLSYEPAIVFLNDQQLMDRILGIALSRFPFESIPFLSLCRALVPLQYITGHENPPITTILGHLKSLTSVLLEEDATYRLTGDEDPYYIELTSPLDVLARNYVHVKENQKLLQFGQSQNGGPPVDSLFLEAGTLGRSLSNQKPLVVQWNYEYSGLRYLGLFLQIAVRERSVPSPQGVESILDISTEMIALLTSLLTAPFTSSSAQRDPAEGRLIAQSVLEEASDSLDSNKDVVSLIFDLFESELHRQFSLGSNNGSVELLVRCTQFAHALLAVFPGRVWPFLGRSGLLGLDGLESRLTAVVAAVEITSGRYEFLVSNIRLFEAAIEDAVTNVVARKAVSTSVTRFGPFSPEKSGTGITEASMKKIILQKEKIMHDVFESSRNWRFESLEERLDLNARICTIASNIIRYCLGVDDNADLTKKMTGCVSPAADYILSIFLSQDNNDIPIRPIMEMLLEATITPNNTIAMKKSQAWRRQTISVLDLCKVLVQANTYLSRPTSRLEDQLFSATPILAKVYAAHEAYRLPIIGLLDAMVRGAGAASQKPPSLLGFLGQGTAKCFLELLSSVDQPLDDDVLAAIIWRFLSAVVSQRQQWLALYLLTGNTPRQSLKDKDQPKPSARPMLKVALGRLSQLDGLSDLISNAGQSNPNRQQAHKSSIKLDVLAHMLEFVTLAADYWPWIMKEIESSKDLIKSSIQFLKSFEYPPGRKPSIEYLPLTIRVAGNLVTLMAMLVHLSREKADKSFSKELIPVLDQLLQSKASRPEYNVSLHGNMRKNFESRYSGFTPLNFKRTSLQRPPLGADYYYDIDLANKVLAYDTAWSGRDPHNFSNEFIVANRNLSLVEAQLNLFHSLRTLAVEMSSVLGTAEKFDVTLASAISTCLQWNRENTLPEMVFSKLAQSRADLAFILLQRLTEIAMDSDKTRAILKPAWDTLRAHAPELGAALVGSNAEYDRTLLKIVYLALQSHVHGSADPTPHDRARNKIAAENMATILEILETAVARGFRSLTTLLHDDASRMTPSDFLLLNGILRTALRVPGVDRHGDQLLDSFGDGSTARYASTLLSWSDQLTVGSDPIYCEVSIMFLVELSNIPSLAESIVTGGSLAQVGTSTILQYFRREGGVGPFQEPRRMFTVWTRAVLPLAINLLKGIGPPIAAEISGLLNQFKGQLSRASESFDIKLSSTSANDPFNGCVSLAMASEAHSLALISAILDMYREAGPSAGIMASDVAELAWDKMAVKEDLENRLQRRNALRESIVATDEREEAWSRQKALAAAGGSENRLEEKVVEELTAALAMLGDGDS